MNEEAKRTLTARGPRRHGNLIASQKLRFAKVYQFVGGVRGRQSAFGYRFLCKPFLNDPIAHSQQGGSEENSDKSERNRAAKHPKKDYQKRCGSASAD